jgi:hypothetical protein
MPTDFFTIDIDGNGDVTCPEVADGEHCVQVKTVIANIFNKQQATGVVFWFSKG